MKVWRVKCEIWGDYIQVKEFTGKEEAKRYAERQEKLGLWDEVSMYEYNNKGEIWRNDKK